MNSQYFKSNSEGWSCDPVLVETVAALIDHTLLKPEATHHDIGRLCLQARRAKFKSVCVNPCWVAFASRELAGSGVAICSVIGFPLGANRTSTKLAEANEALSQGATELDVVQNIGALRSGDTQLVEREIEVLAALAHGSGALLKVILETCLLNDEEKRLSCRIAVGAQADFVKTSTGFSTAGATAADVSLMRAEASTGRDPAPPNERGTSADLGADRESVVRARSLKVTAGVGVKASGGIRTLATLREMVTAGATRIGSSSGLQILRELESEQGPSPMPEPILKGGPSPY